MYFIKYHLSEPVWEIADQGWPMDFWCSGGRKCRRDAANGANFSANWAPKRLVGPPHPIFQTGSKETEMTRFIFVSILLISSLGSVKAEATSTTYDMDFEKCLAFIRQSANESSSAPINIVETNILRIVRFPAKDGSVLITCSKLDNKAIITMSDKK